MSQTGAAGIAQDGGSPGQVSVTLTVGAPNSDPPTVTHPGVVGTPPHLAYTGIQVPAELDVALLVIVAGALIVRLAALTSDGRRELLRLLRVARTGAAS